MLTFNVKKVWFDKIKSGEKTHEYREFKEYWTRIFKKEFGELDFSVIELRFGNPKTFPMQHKICFMNGMISENKKPRIYAKLKSISLKHGMETDLKFNGPVYDIEFELEKK
jgi:hypothetical protein